MDLKERFKAYLEQQFRAIAPTAAAKDLRIRTLKELMDAAQDKRIKGLEDEELIYRLCIEELGDFEAKLKEFESAKREVENKKRKTVLGVACGVGAALALVIIYIIIGLTVKPGGWHPGWLLLLGGAFAGVIAVSCLLAVKFAKAKKFLLMRVFPPVVIVLVSVFLFLLLNLVFHVEKAWLIFLAMVIAIFVFDTVLAYATFFKFRHIELCVAVEVSFVMLYVILGLTLKNFWGMGWLLCLAGVVCAIVMLIVFIAKRNKEKDKKEKEKLRKKYDEEDEAYYTMWDD